MADRPPGTRQRSLTPGRLRGALVVLRLLTALLVYQMALFVVSIAVFLIGARFVAAKAQASFGLVGLGLAEAAALVSVLVLWRFIDRRPLQQLGLHRPGAARRWLRGAAIATLMMGSIVLVLYTLVDRARWDVNPDPLRAALALSAGLIGFAIQGPAEEVLFRGYILENVRAEWGLTWAVIASSLAFALFHLLNPAVGPLPLINLVLFGAATALYKARLDAGQLWGVFSIHTVWNWLQQVVFGLPNSGLPTAPENALFVVTPNASLPGPLWGTGFGPEGTVGASLVLLALIAAAFRRPASWARTASEMESESSSPAATDSAEGTLRPAV